MGFEGLLEWGFWLWTPDVIWKFVPDHRISIWKGPLTKCFCFDGGNTKNANYSPVYMLSLHTWLMSAWISLSSSMWGLPHELQPCQHAVSTHLVDVTALSTCCPCTPGWCQHGSVSAPLRGAYLLNYSPVNMLSLHTWLMSAWISLSSSTWGLPHELQPCQHAVSTHLLDVSMDQSQLLYVGLTSWITVAMPHDFFKYTQQPNS